MRWANIGRLRERESRGNPNTEQYGVYSNYNGWNYHPGTVVVQYQQQSPGSSAIAEAAAAVRRVEQAARNVEATIRFADKAARAAAITAEKAVRNVEKQAEKTARRAERQAELAARVADITAAKAARKAEKHVGKLMRSAQRQSDKITGNNRNRTVYVQQQAGGAALVVKITPDRAAGNAQIQAAVTAAAPTVAYSAAITADKEVRNAQLQAAAAASAAAAAAVAVSEIAPTVGHREPDYYNQNSTRFPVSAPPAPPITVQDDLETMRWKKAEAARARVENLENELREARQQYQLY